jgi:hypothetical protein
VALGEFGGAGDRMSLWKKVAQDVAHPLFVEINTYIFFLRKKVVQSFWLHI